MRIVLAVGNLAVPQAIITTVVCPRNARHFSTQSEIRQPTPHRCRFAREQQDAAMREISGNAQNASHAPGNINQHVKEIASG